MTPRSDRFRVEHVAASRVLGEAAIARLAAEDVIFGLEGREARRASGRDEGALARQFPALVGRVR